MQDLASKSLPRLDWILNIEHFEHSDVKNSGQAHHFAKARLQSDDCFSLSPRLKHA